MMKGSLRTASSKQLASYPKKVQFDDYAEVHDVLAVDDYSPEEIANMWFVDVEYSRMKRNNKTITKMINKGRYDDDEENVCFRGLEHKSIKGAKQRKQAKHSALCAVLSAQTMQLRQLLDGNLDWAPIREAYQTVSSECQNLAHEAGLADAFYAWHDYKTHSLYTVEEGIKNLNTSGIGMRPVVYASPLQRRRSLSLRH